MERAKFRIRCRVGVSQGRHAAKSRNGFDQEFLPFSVKLGREDTDARCVAIGSRQRVDQSFPDHIVRDADDRNRFGRLLRGTGSYTPGGFDDIDLGFC